jgi:hypothetical protein
MTFVSRLLAAFLVPLLVSLSVSVAMNRTVFDTDYLKDLAKKTDLYTKAISTAETLMTGQGMSAKEVAKLKSTFEKAATPGYLEGQVSQFLDQLDVRGEGSTPSLDLTQFAAEAKKAGAEVPAELSKPIPLSPDVNSKIQASRQSTERTQLISLVSAGLLLIALILISVKSRHYGALMYVFGMTAVLLGVLAMIVRTLPSEIIKGLTSNGDIGPIFKDLLTSLSTQLTTDIATVLLWFAVGYAIALALTIGFSTVSHFRHKGDAKAV